MACKTKISRTCLDYERHVTPFLSELNLEVIFVMSTNKYQGIIPQRMVHHQRAMECVVEF